MVKELIQMWREYKEFTEPKERWFSKFMDFIASKEESSPFPGKDWYKKSSIKEVLKDFDEAKEQEKPEMIEVCDWASGKRTANGVDITQPKECELRNSYWDKKGVYGDDPLAEIIYEIEDKLYVSDDYEGKMVSLDDLKPIFNRHYETIREFKKRNIAKPLSIKEPDKLSFDTTKFDYWECGKDFRLTGKIQDLIEKFK